MWSRTANLALVLLAVFAAGPALSADLNSDAINSAEPSRARMEPRIVAQ
jgi:hypothetical protein